MPEMDVHVLETTPSAATPENITCPPEYSLMGPQVEPEASWWLECFERCPVPRPVTIPELRNRLVQDWGGIDQFPVDAPTLRAELQELIILSRLRDEPAAFIGHQPARPQLREPQQLRLPLSMFLQLRPQPIGAVVNTARDGAFPVINTGRELARYFENETPGLAHRLALNYMLRETPWSPPRQAWVWAALDVTIYSALAAAWYLKWRGGQRVERRPRPWECFNQLDVLYDRLPNSTNSADAQRRSYPPGVRPEQPQPFRPGELVTPEAAVPDLLMMPPTQPTPGTPRHPAYPSGHSTYSAAATRLLVEFFPRYREQLCRLADNAGVARLWAGVHWRSDHTFGQRVGTSVAELIIDQLRATGIPRFPAPRPGDEKPPMPVPNPCPGGPKWGEPNVPTLPPCQPVRRPPTPPTKGGARKASGKAVRSRRGASRQ
jgi:hypothetical protein